MTSTNKTKFAVMLAVIVLAGCSSMSEVMPGADGTFSVSTTGRSTQTPFEVLTDLYKKVAEKFCGERGMAVEVIKKDIKVGRAGSDPDVRIGVGGGSGEFSSGFGGGEASRFLYLTERHHRRTWCLGVLM